MKRRSVFFHDVHGTLTVEYPANVKIELSGNRYYGYTLEIHEKPVSKRVLAQLRKELEEKSNDQ